MPFLVSGVSSSPAARRRAARPGRARSESLEGRVLLSAGDPDTWFAGDGIATAASALPEQGAAAALTADGKLLVAGTRQAAGGDFTVVRFSTDGSLDPSFGAGGADGDGRVTTDFFAGADAANALAVLADGKFLVGGSASGRAGAPAAGADFALARYKADGSLDTTFARGGADGDGKVTTDFFGTTDGPGDAAHAWAVLPDGRILLVGSAQLPSGRMDFALARYNPDGSLDPTFGRGGADGDGRVTTDFGADDEARAAAVVSGGKVVVLGYSADAASSTARVALARYNPEGSLDTTFGRGGDDGDGKVVTRIAGVDRSFGRALAVLPSGRLVVAGQTRDDNGYSVALARYLADGTLDRTFGVGDDYGGGVADGFTVTPISGAEDATCVAVTPGGKIVVGGSSYGAILVAGYNADGSRDRTFERSGWWNVRVPVGESASATAVLLRPAGQILLAGTAVDTAGAASIAAAQLQGSAGDRDTDDQMAEAVSAPVGTTLAGREIDRITDVDLYKFSAAAGQRVAFDVDRPAGGTLDAYLRLFSGDGTELAVSDTDAAPGETRGADPYLEYRFTSGGTYYVGISANPNRSYRPVTGDFDDFGGTTGAYALSLADASSRAAAPGDLDLRFGGSGVVRHGFGASEGSGNAAAILPDGKLLVAGASGNDVLLARYNADGTLDTSFGGGDGFVSTSFTGADADGSPRPTSAAAEAVAVVPGGKILVAGTASSGSPGGSLYREIALARFTPDGTLDTTFGRGGPEGDGKVLDRPGSPAATLSEAHTLLALPGGQFLVGGAVGNATAVIRYNADGTLDTSFAGGSGVAAVAEPFGTADHSPRASPRGGYANVVALLPDGKILLAGTMNVYETAEEGPGDWFYDLGTLDRFNPDGTIDATFGGGTGRVVNGRISDIGPVVPLPDGRVLAVLPAFRQEASSSDFAVARFNADGSLDPTFAPGGTDGDGIAAVDFFGHTDRSNALSLDAAGNILVAGMAEAPSGYFQDHAIALARLLPDGRLDTRFGGGDGIVVNDFGLPAARNEAHAIVLCPDQGQPDGGVVLVGRLGDMPSAARFLNNIALPSNPRLEAEQALLNGAVVSRAHAGFTGSGFVDFINATGDWAQFAVQAQSGGRYELSFRYANGGAADRSTALWVNGATVAGGVNFSRTGSWTTWRDASVTVPLAAGSNKVRVLASGQSGPNLDSLSLRPVTPPASVTYQAESAVLSGPVVLSNVPGFTGAGFADYQHRAGDFAEFAIDVPADGAYALDFRYANGGSSDRPLELRLDGQVLTGRLSFEPTGNWSTWNDLTQPAVLTAGRHLVRLTSTGSNGPNLDALTVTSDSAPPPVEPATLQAEVATLSGPLVGRGGTGFTGTGYADYQNASGDSVEFIYHAPSVGDYVLDFRYANGGSSDRPLELKLNGAVARPSLSFTSTGSWSDWRTVSAVVALVPGPNTIRLSATGKSGPNFDALTVRPAAPIRQFFSTGFDTQALHQSLEDADASYIIGNGVIHTTRTGSDSYRRATFARSEPTTSTTSSTKSRSATGITFIGLGTGEPTPPFSEPARGSLYLRLHGPTIVDGRVDVSYDSPFNYIALDFGRLSTPGPAPRPHYAHRRPGAVRGGRRRHRRVQGGLRYHGRPEPAPADQGRPSAGVAPVFRQWRAGSAVR